MSYFAFVHHPIISLAFTSLILAFMSLWIHRKPWLWGSFLTIAFIFAFLGKLIELKIFVALALLAGAHLVLTTKTAGISRLIFIAIASIISITLIWHFFPGFHNWKLGENLQISQDAYPYSFYLNFDKPFIGFFPLAISIPLLHRMHVRSIILKTMTLTALGVLVLIILALHLHLVKVDLKIPHISAIWLIANLFFVVVPEEAFFRGFLQREIHDHFNTKWSGAFSVITVSLLFSFLHFTLLHDFGYAFLTFTASLIYGSIYQTTRSVESSIFCHYLFNAIHFFCFTYPVLRLR